MRDIHGQSFREPGSMISMSTGATSWISGRNTVLHLGETVDSLVVLPRREPGSSTFALLLAGRGLDITQSGTRSAASCSGLQTIVVVRKVASIVNAVFCLDDGACGHTWNAPSRYLDEVCEHT
jgi:hypothetical protein